MFDGFPGRVSVRKLMMWVALVAAACAGLHGGPRAGLYWGAGEVSAGLCRDARDVVVGAGGPAPAWKLGLWHARGGLPIYGLVVQGGRVTCRIWPGSGWEAL